MTDVVAPSPASAVAVRLRGVRRIFDGGMVALNGIDLNVAPGEFLAVLGPSGSGKSTLLRLIAGLDQPDGGAVMTSEVTATFQEEGTVPGSIPPVVDDHGAARLRARIAYVFQDAHLLPWRNVLKNVALPLELKGVGRAERLSAAAEAIERVGLSDAAGRFPNQLSGGMRMRVSLARAMITRPKLLLLDEPFAALDEITRQRLDEQLRELWASQGMTVVFVTHSISEAVFLAQRAIVLSKRPARVIEERRIDLPEQRAAELRATLPFAMQMQPLYRALRGEEP